VRNDYHTACIHDHLFLRTHAGYIEDNGTNQIPETVVYKPHKFSFEFGTYDSTLLDPGNIRVAVSSANLQEY
jgi:hypothetical protein